MEENVEKGSIIRSDGHPSYPKAVNDFGSLHEIVNHSKSFKNESGQTTNKIENLWSGFKTLYRSRHGLRKENIEGFIAEFAWKKRMLNRKSCDDLDNIFLLFIKSILG